MPHLWRLWWSVKGEVSKLLVRTLRRSKDTMLRWMWNRGQVSEPFWQSNKRSPHPPQPTPSKSWEVKKPWFAKLHQSCKLLKYSFRCWYSSCQLHYQYPNACYKNVSCLSTFPCVILHLIQAPSSEKEKLQKEIFAFSKNVQFGFPYKPSDMDWDPMLR